MEKTETIDVKIGLGATCETDGECFTWEAVAKVEVAYTSDSFDFSVVSVADDWGVNEMPDFMFDDISKFPEFMAKAINNEVKNKLTEMRQ